MNGKIQILLNGQIQLLKESVSLAQLLQQLKVELPYVAVAINEEILPRSQMTERRIQNGDRIEIVRPVAGG